MQKPQAKFKQNRTKMKNLFTLLTFSSLLLSASCGKEKTNPISTASLNISFKATYGGKTLVLDQNNTYEYRGKPVRFSKISFYLSDLAVLNEDGERALSEVQFVDLTKSHASEASAKSGTIIGFNKIPVGEYKGLKFGVGVAADLNRTMPSDYSINHPLGANNIGEYREVWNSYIFAKIEGQFDIDEDGFDEDDIVFAYHTGMDELYTPIELDDFKTLKAGETSNINFELDIRELFIQPRGELFSLETYDPNNNDPFYQREGIIIIMNNFEKALHIK